MEKVFLAVLLSLFVCGVAKVSFANSIRVEGYVYDSKDVGLNGVKVSTKDATPSQIDVAGYWKGYFSTSLIDSETIYLKLEQFKQRVDGTMSTGEGG